MLARNTIDKIGTKSAVWQHFKIWSAKPSLANCINCGMDVKIGEKHISTSKLDNHMRIYHSSLTKAVLLNNAESSLSIQISEADKENIPQKKQIQGNITNHFKKKKHAPEFPGFYVDWIVSAYQPLDTCGDPAFRKMFTSLNDKVDVIGKDKVRTILFEKEANAKATMKEMTKKLDISDYLSENISDLSYFSTVSVKSHDLIQICRHQGSMIKL